MIDFDTLVLGPVFATFGEPVIFTPAGGTALPLTGIFNDKFADIAWRSDVAVSTIGTAVALRESDLPTGITPAKYDLITARGQNFQVMKINPDGMGHLLLVLMDANP